MASPTFQPSETEDSDQCSIVALHMYRRIGESMAGNFRRGSLIPWRLGGLWSGAQALLNDTPDERHMAILWFASFCCRSCTPVCNAALVVTKEHVTVVSIHLITAHALQQVLPSHFVFLLRH